MRRHAEGVAIALAPRLPLALLRPGDACIAPKNWGDTAVRLPPEFAGMAVRDALTGQAVTLRAPMLAGALLDRAPVALLADVRIPPI